ncbi:MAG TPA: hypothetical protein VIT93_03750 [Dehalococcoidia bacterium]
MARDNRDENDEERVEADWAALTLAALPIMMMVAILVLVLAIEPSLRPW